MNIQTARLLGGTIIAAGVLATPTYAQVGSAPPPAINQPTESERPVTPQASTTDAATRGVPEAGAAADEGIGDIVVTAQRASESAQRVPISLTAFSAGDLAKHSIGTVAELQSQTPGLSFRGSTSDAATPLIAMRGQTQTRNDLGKQANVGVYYDDVYRPNGTGTVSPGALFDVERIEVLRGPQGTLFGRNTTGGAISIHSRLPTTRAEGAIQASVGNYNTYDIDGMINMPIDGVDGGLRIVSSYIDTDGYGRNLTNDRRNGGWTASTRVALLAHASDNLTITLRGDYFRSHTGSNAFRPVGINPGTLAAPSPSIRVAARLLGISSPVSPLAPAGLTAQQITTVRDAIFASLPRSVYDYQGSAGQATFSKLRLYGGSVELAYDLTDTLQLKSVSAYRRQDNELAQDADGTVFAILGNGTSPPGGQFLDQFTQEVQLNGSLLDDRLQIASGIYYFDLRGLDNTNSAALLPLGGGIAKSPASIVNTSVSPYGQVTFAVTDQFKVTGGVRYTREKNTLTSRNTNTAVVADGGCQVPVIFRVDGQCKGIFPNKFSDVSYLVGVDYAPTRSLLFYGKVTKGFKAGGQNTFGTLNPGSYTPFAPETAINYELGIKADWLDRRLRTNLSAYRVDYKDIQRSVIIPFPLGVTNIVQNAGKGRIYGLEAEVVIRPIDRLTISGTYALTSPKYLEYRNGAGVDLSGNHFPSTPRHQASASISYEVPLNDGSLDFNLDGYAQSYVDYDPDNHTPFTNGGAQQGSYALLNARVAWHIESYDLTVALYGKNILDRRYNVGGYDTTASLGYALVTYGAPATYGLQVTKRF